MDNNLIFGNIGLVFVIFIIIVIGIALYVPELLNNLSAIIRTIICAALMFYYNPFKKVDCRENDALIVFSAALLILVTSFVIETAIYNLAKMQLFFKLSY